MTKKSDRELLRDLTDKQSKGDQSAGKIKLVITGTYSEFVDWCRENRQPTHSKYVVHVTSTSQLIGYEKDQIELHFIGTYERLSEVVDAAIQKFPQAFQDALRRLGMHDGDRDVVAE